MVVELMGVRLLAPWFGQSQIVWTNVIGVVLLALAIGQWLGGRWAESPRGVRPGVLLVVAGGFCVGLPDLVEIVSAWVMPSDLSLGEAYGFVALGSLLVALLALGLPMFALGAVAPWLVRLSRDASEHPGRATGRVLAAGTVGSLIGTFGATHVLIAWVGSAGAVRGAGIVMVLTGLAVLATKRSRLSAAALALALMMGVQALPGRPVDLDVLEERETLYQWARVVEVDGLRMLKLNEGLDSFHSAWRPGEVLTGLYFDSFLLPALLAPQDIRGRRRVMVIGLGGGTMARQIHEIDPQVEVIGVEIDPELIDLGMAWLGLTPEMASLVPTDGRVALRVNSEPVGAILCDAYSDQIYVPHHLCTREFFEEMRDQLLPGGIVALNVGGITRDDAVLSAIATTLASVFSGVELARVPGSRNWILLGWNGVPAGLEMRRRILAESGLGDSLTWMVDDSRFSTWEANGDTALVDGHSHIEALAHEAWSQW